MTAQLGILAFIVSAVVGLTLGVVGIESQWILLDYVGVFFATVGASLPNFVLASFLIVIFAVKLGWFQVLGWGGPTQFSDALDSSAWHFKKMVLPVISVSMLPAANIARVTRASMLEVMNQDYIRTAHAKGLTQYAVIMRHTVKNAMIPVLTIMGLIAAVLVTCFFIIEQTFAIPGVGRAFVDAVIRRDYAMIMGATLFYTAVVVSANLIVDILYAVFDPRIRIDEGTRRTRRVAARRLGVAKPRAWSLVRRVSPFEAQPARHGSSGSAGAVVGSGRCRALHHTIRRYDPYQDQDYEHLQEGPSAKYFFGTDNLGRDWSRTLTGVEISLQIGLGTQVIVLVIRRGCGSRLPWVAESVTTS